MEKNPPVRETDLRATISFKFLFEEVWDYRLKFLDWRTNSLLNTRDPSQEITPHLKIEFLEPNKSLVAITSSNKSHTKEMPYWSNIGNGLLFRGTWSELISNYIVIKI